MNARGSTEVVVATIGLVDGGAEPDPVHDDPGDGGCHDDGDAADAALGVGAGAAARRRRGAARTRGVRGCRASSPNMERLLRRGRRQPERPFRLAARRAARRDRGVFRRRSSTAPPRARTRQRRNAEAVAKATASTAEPDTAEADATPRAGRHHRRGRERCRRGSGRPGGAQGLRPAVHRRRAGRAKRMCSTTRSRGIAGEFNGAVRDRRRARRASPTRDRGAPSRSSCRSPARSIRGAAPRSRWRWRAPITAR